MTTPQKTLFNKLKGERVKPSGFSHPAWDDVFAAAEVGVANNASVSWLIREMLIWPRATA